MGHAASFLLQSQVLQKGGTSLPGPDLLRGCTPSQARPCIAPARTGELEAVKNVVQATCHSVQFCCVSPHFTFIHVCPSIDKASPPKHS